MGTSGGGTPRSGFTLIEMMAALAILALSLTVATLSIDGLTTTWRLRAAAHEVESIVRQAQSAAATRGCPVQVLYDVPEGSFQLRLFGEGTGTFSARSLPDGVRFDAVVFANGTAVTRDVAAVGVYTDGSVDGHTVSLAAGDSTVVRLRFHRLTGEATYEEDDPNAIRP